MTEAATPEAPPAPTPSATAGALLRAAREQSGLPVDEFAALLKVTARRVELIEADQFDQLPDPVFVRALAQSMCRTLKIDPTPVLALLPQTPAHRLDRIHVGLNTPFREGPTQLLPDNWMGRLLPFLGGAALLVAGALLFYFLPSNWQSPAKVSARNAASAASTAASQPTPAVVETIGSQMEAVPAPSAKATPIAEHAAAPGAERAVTPSLERAGLAPTDVTRATRVPAPALEAKPASGSVAVPTAAVAAAPVAPVVRAAQVAPASAAAVAKLPAAAPAGLLQLRTSEAAWVQVQDAQGALLFSRELRAGEAVGVNGATPLKVTVGNVRATQIAFRGKAMDLRSFTRDNVARIELQ